MSRRSDLDSKRPAQASGEVDAFLRKVAAAPAVVPAGQRGRLIFALDATMSRQPAWDTACALQSDMFAETAQIGGLNVQLVYFRGHGEFSAGRWTAAPAELAAEMTGVSCRGGHTQIGRVLRHAVEERKRARVGALVYVGDCFEENADAVCAIAGELGLLNVPAFMFHEGGEPTAARVFREIARLTGGAYAPFDASAAATLRALLRAAAVYAAGGHKALSAYGRKAGGAALQIAHQMKPR